MEDILNKLNELEAHGGLFTTSGKDILKQLKVLVLTEQEKQKAIEFLNEPHEPSKLIHQVLLNIVVGKNKYKNGSKTFRKYKLNNMNNIAIFNLSDLSKPQLAQLLAFCLNGKIHNSLINKTALELAIENELNSRANANL